MINNEKNFPLRIEKSDYDKLKMMADRDDRSVNSLINIILRKEIKKQEMEVKN